MPLLLGGDALVPPKALGRASSQAALCAASLANGLRLPHAPGAPRINRETCCESMCFVAYKCTLSYLHVLIYMQKEGFVMGGWMEFEVSASFQVVSMECLE